MPAIIKNHLRIANSDIFRDYVIKNPCYAFLSNQDPWNDEQNPPIPVDSTNQEYFVLSDVIGIKRILANDLVSVVPRINWESGVIYDQYQDDVNIIDDRNPDNNEFYKFYVVTEDFNVYKCISNNNGIASTARPTGTNTAPFTAADGYVWKYMYTIQASQAFKFMTPNWMPCYTLTTNDGFSQWASQQAAVPGTVDSIEVTDGGTGYDAGTPPTITINGDGSGATATATVNPVSGIIEKITMTAYGSGYTYATVNITDPDGVGATAVATISPRKGHGADPKGELGATYLMMKVTLESDEGGLIPTGVDYRTTGIIAYPREAGETCTVIELASINLFAIGQTLEGSVSGATGTIIQINYDKKLLYVDTVDTFLQSDDVSSTAYNSQSIVSMYSEPSPLVGSVFNGASIEPNTGEILYVAHREFINRVENQNEEIIAVLSF